MSTRALECGTCGRDHPSARPCKRDPSAQGALLRAAQAAARELQRLWEVRQRRFDKCSGEMEPDLKTLTRLQNAIKLAKR